MGSELLKVRLTTLNLDGGWNWSDDGTAASDARRHRICYYLIFCIHTVPLIDFTSFTRSSLPVEKVLPSPRAVERRRVAKPCCYYSIRKVSLKSIGSSRTVRRFELFQKLVAELQSSPRRRFVPREIGTMGAMPILELAPGPKPVSTNGHRLSTCS